MEFIFHNSFAMLELAVSIQNCYTTSPYSKYYKPKYTEKTIDLSQVTDSLYHIMLYRLHLAMSRIRTPKLTGYRY
jgi:hypothetical protein